MKFVVGVVVLLAVASSLPVEKTAMEDQEEVDGKILENSGHHEGTDDQKTGDDTSAPNSTAKNSNTTSNASGKPEEVEKCHDLMTKMKGGFRKQNCTPHDDCYGISCEVEIIGYQAVYNVSILPCTVPSAKIYFNITSLKDAVYVGDIHSSGNFYIPNGNITLPGADEGETKLEVTLNKAADITHFMLNVVVDYRFDPSQPLRTYASNTLVPGTQFAFKKDICTTPTSPPKLPKQESEDTESDDKILGIVPKKYVKDKTSLALIITGSVLVVVILIVIIWMVVSKRRNSGFYRTYVSTDENRHLTKGNDGFEPLDDSDID